MLTDSLFILTFYCVSIHFHLSIHISIWLAFEIKVIERHFQSISCLCIFSFFYDFRWNCSSKIFRKFIIIFYCDKYWSLLQFINLSIDHSYNISTLLHSKLWVEMKSVFYLLYHYIIFFSRHCNISFNFNTSSLFSTFLFVVFSPEGMFWLTIGMIKCWNNICFVTTIYVCSYNSFDFLYLL